jgi:hypothetical protein
VGQTVYVVTEGSYSDYHICAVFLDKEKADAMARVLGNEAEVEEYEADSTDMRDVGEIYLVQMDLSGDNAKVKVAGSYYRGLLAYDKEWSSCIHRAPWCSPELWTVVAAKDEGHAIKVANERRTAYLLAHPEVSIDQR